MGSLHFKTEAEFQQFLRTKPGAAPQPEEEPERPSRRSPILSLILWLSLVFTVMVLAATCFGGL